MPKQRMDPKAATSMTLALKCRTSATTAVTAKINPRTLSQSGAWTSALASLRRRSCSSRAASPMAATTTRASGLEKAERLGEVNNKRGRGSRVGKGVGQGVPFQVIQGGAGRFQFDGVGAELSNSLRQLFHSSDRPTSFFPADHNHALGRMRVVGGSHSAWRGSPLLTA